MDDPARPANVPSKGLSTGAMSMLASAPLLCTHTVALCYFELSVVTIAA